MTEDGMVFIAGMVTGILIACFVLVPSLLDLFGSRLWRQHMVRHAPEKPATEPVRRADAPRLGRPRQRATAGSGATRGRQRRERAARAAGL